MTKFGLVKDTHKRTPAATTVKITRDDAGIEVDQTLYISMIGSLLYLTTTSRSDICHADGVCVWFQANPKESHLANAKRIIIYVKGTSDYGLWYSKDSSAQLVGYCDADQADNAVLQEDVSSQATIQYPDLVKKQNNIFLFTAESECILCSDTMDEANIGWVWSQTRRDDSILR